MMSKMILFVVGLLGLASFGSAQLTQLGQCETINLMDNFVLNTFIGTWYEAGKSSNQVDDCSRLEFGSGTGTITVSNPSVVNNFPQTATGSAVHTTGTSRLTLTLTSSNDPIDFWILNTDYTSWAIAINCVNMGNLQRSVNVWQLGRAPNSFDTPATLTAANNALSSAIGITASELTSVDHSTNACTELPVIGAGQPVILPGQCSTTVPVTQNFQVAQFIGTWYEISSYYSENAVGTCARADYSLVGTTVNIVNSQVLNNRLDTITGTATVIGTDGAGRLNVVLNVNGVPVTQELLILDTNYNGYAVSYTCDNLPNNQRRVNSWILSRTQSISAESQLEVNRVINSLLDLNTAYFQLTDQSADGCFYLPEPEVGRPVIFPGQCDDTVAAVPSFNLGQFEGTWHEVQTYPKEQQTGSCVNHAFTTGTTANTLNVVSNQVVNQLATSASGNVAFESTDGSGRLRLSMTVDGVAINFPYWILATDYTSYALVYSCINRPDNTRAVYSWKLSRTQTLPDAANTPINTVIAAVQVLDNLYYEAVDQSAAGCFYYPVLIPGVPVVFPGQCDQNIPVQANFDPTRYMDLWHDIESYPSTFQQGTCNNAFYTLTPQGTVNIFNTQVVSQRLDTITGVAVPDPTQPAKLVVSFPIAGTDQTTSTNYWVLATDYDTYSLVYTCENLANDRRAVFSWKLGRSKAPFSAAADQAMDAVINSIDVLDSQYFAPRDQTAAGCFYFPEPVDGRPVIFPGQCDETVSAVPNFNLGQFEGTWHEVQTYPKEQQTGSCVNHAFTTGTTANTLNLVSNQVVNLRAASASGNVAFESTDTSGKLRLSMTVNGLAINIPYWILATDYTSYALVYSCINRPDDTRAVYSWKLSRTQTLPDAANTPINTVIAAVQVLDNLYYEAVDQSAAGCFYYPVLIPGVPVVFPGQCDQNIPVQANFDPTRYMDLWHDIESYPSTFQQGTCNNAFYTLTPQGTVNIFNTQVVSQRLDTITGVAVPDPTQPAKLVVSFPIAGTDQTTSTNYWVLATDYDTYSLVYTCENLANDRRAVFSWKLGRSKAPFSAAADQAMDAVINSIDVLDSQYFAPRDQTAAGCFYYPENTPGVPVVFPGQCNENIPVQANFDPTRYMDLWHDIESYPSTFQQGTCNNAFYTLTPQGTVDVFNTQVISQRLDTITGVAVPDPTQPAKLVVSFPIAGTDQTTSTNYWVLATDYDSYSLVYTCENLANDRRAVFSWKLGRSKAPFSVAAIQAMDAVISSIDVLDSQYFATRDQTAAGCFYFPEPVDGRPVIFPGQCDETVAAVPNFNMAQFVGTWHEVQTYPKEQQPGSCVNHDFTTGTTANTLNVVSNQVVNQIANSASGNVAFESTDGSGRLRLSMTVNGLAINIPYWILATDYSTYALVYSCINRADDTRAVYSWKLSRTQTLPEAANIPINTAIAAVQVLDTKYYETVEQSVASCLAYPEIPPGEPIILEGQCGTVTPVTNFQFYQFGGTWYEAARYPSARQSGDCAASQFATSSMDGYTLTQTIIYNERQTVVSGPAFIATDGTGVLTATLSDGAGLTYSTTIYILDTDYVDFALLYSCDNIPGTNNRQIYSWKFSRTQAGLSQVANDRIAEVVANNIDLFENYYQSTGQASNDCFYYPDFLETPESIILPGACPVIAAQPNFSPAEYLGNWYDVASYPIESQFGTCSRAEYTLDDGVISIRNTMVVDGELRTQLGIARLSAGGTGILTVTFVLENGEEVVTTYYILATDYTSFSLVYNCRNLPDETRQVFSWKLSRTPTLSAEANTAIDNIVSNTQGLLEEYYLPTGQTDQDCFYVPQFESGQSVQFRGACTPPTTQPNFNVNQYLGWWHEIERYPSDDVPGQCTSANIFQAANAIQVVDISVSGGVVNETISTATISADGTISFVRDGVAVVWYVLATDYTSYSLLYSCEDVQTGWGTYRRVWSAKHSKSRALSAADNTAINAVIAGNNLLHQHLYENVDQSDLACFHYRDDIGDQVVLPGQCDTQIPVQSGFEISRFAGRWYQIERYPYPQVSSEGTCVGARYTVNGDSVRVVNWEVLGGTLNTIEGTATVDAGTATLQVTLPQEGSEDSTTTALRVLLTDYDNYALLYTCVNINAFQRSVGAFKVSRERSLSNDDRYAIENYMNTREELHQPYFISISHNDQCPEPSSALLIKSSIIVMLVCVVLQLVM